MTFIPTPEQAEIISAAAETEDNLLISALAGAAKTSTLVLIAEALPSVRLLCLAFNVRIKKEMEKRMPDNATVMTLNGLGHRVWSDTIGRRLELNTSKTYGLTKALVEDLGPDDRKEAYEYFSDITKAIDFGKTCGYVPDGIHPEAQRLMGDSAFFAHLDEEPTPLMMDIIRQVSTLSIKRGLAGEIDFADQLLLPTVFRSSFPRFPLVLTDESQDFSALNHVMLGKLVRQRIIAVGDECQPEGTLVSVVRKIGDRWNKRIIEQVPIEELKIGDRLVGYDSDYSEFMFNRTIKGITSRPFSGRLIKLITPQGVSKYTPNHHCYANFSRLRSHTALYLMRFGSRWRVGVAAMDYKQSSGPIARARVEGADAMWILATFPTKQEALAAEATIQAAYGIPDITFQWAGVHTNGYHAPETLKAVWNRLDNVDFTSRAADLLADFKREMDFPFWRAGQKYGTIKRPMVVHACNLLKGGEILPFTGKKREQLSDWQDYELSFEDYHGMVYSLTVSHNHLYIADNIVTHNCQSIYGFRGAHEDSMELLRREFSMRQLVLSISFRCPKEVIRAAQWRAPHMQWPEWAKEGEVRTLSSWSVEDIPADSAIICRNNAPLFAMAIRLLKERRPVELIGNDIGKYLIKVMKKLGNDDIKRSAAKAALMRWRDDKLRKARNKGPVLDQYECIKLFLNEGETLRQAIAYAAHIFSSTGPVKLMTGHKSKGLEFPHVFFLDPDLVRMKEPQDRNLKYVIQTRAQETLTYVQSEAFVGEHLESDDDPADGEEGNGD